MRPHNSPSSKMTNIYKSSTMLKKVGPQQTIVSSNMIESKRQLNTVRSQQLLRSTSKKQENEYVKSTNRINTVNQKPVRTISQTVTLENKINNLGSVGSGINNINRSQEKAYTFQNQDQYIGQWSYDQKQLKQKPHGYGCYKFKKERLQYRGYFNQGLMHGTGTLHRLLNRGKPEIIYQGEWMNGQKNGTGKYYYDENISYQGNWNRNRKEGKGKFRSPQGQFDGLWLNDKKHGKGLLKLNNGTTYDGDWQNDEFVNGQIKYSNGDFYKGQVNQRFQRHLQGEYVLGSKQQNYKGTWRNNKKEGQGEILYNANGQKYTGQMRNDIRQGSNCMYEWKNGTKVICSFQDNFPSKGKIILPDKSSFDFDMKLNKTKR